MGKRLRGGHFVVSRGGQHSVACMLLTRYAYTLLSNMLSKDYEGLTNLLISAPNSDKLVTTVPSQTD